jgi:rubredoxin
VAIPLTTESAPPPAALIDGDQTLIVELRKGDPKLVALVREAEEPEVERGMVAAGGGRKGKRAEYRCAACGYGIVVYERPPGCPMCSETRWEHVEWRPFSQLLDDFVLPVGTRSQRRRLRAPPSPTAE